MADITHEITIRCTKGAAEDLEPLLEAAKRLGAVGASRVFELDDSEILSDLGHGPQYGFDGDGSSQIESITINTLKEAGMGALQDRMREQQKLALELEQLAENLPWTVDDTTLRIAVQRLRTLAGTSRTAHRVIVASEAIETEMRDYCSGLARITQKILRRVPELTAHRVNEANHYAETTLKETRTKYRVQFGIDACDLDNVLVVATILQGESEVARHTYDGMKEAADIAEEACTALLAELNLT
jgi:hypothetical protein